jgi:hypothetical protein
MEKQILLFEIFMQGEILRFRSRRTLDQGIGLICFQNL